MPSKSFFQVVVLAVLVCSGAVRAQTPPAPRPNELDDQALNAAISGLDDPAQRYASFRKLVLFFWSYPHSGSAGIVMSYGSPELNDRVKRAGQAMGKVAKDVSLVKQALADTNRTLQLWAIGDAGGILSDARGPDPRGEIADPVALNLLVEVRKFTSSDDEHFRREAEHALRYIASERDLLQKVLQIETSPENVMFMVSGTRPEIYTAQMNEHLLRLLSTQDLKVRSQALVFIDQNSNMAEMYHLDFAKAVVEKVLELAGKESDRAASAGALAALYEKNAVESESILPKLREMATDKDAAVRQKLALALYAHDKVPELHAILMGMAKDSDDYVRLLVILSSGSQTHVAELRELATSKNPEVAKEAAEVLNGLERRSPAPTEGK